MRLGRRLVLVSHPKLHYEVFVDVELPLGHEVGILGQILIVWPVIDSGACQLSLIELLPTHLLGPLGELFTVEVVHVIDQGLVLRLQNFVHFLGR